MNVTKSIFDRGAIRIFRDASRVRVSNYIFWFLPRRLHLKLADFYERGSSRPQSIF